MQLSARTLCTPAPELGIVEHGGESEPYQTLNPKPESLNP